VTVVAAQRALIGAPVTLTYQHRAANGEPVAPGGTPTVTAVDSLGGTVTVGSVTDVGNGVYTAVVAAGQNTEPDLWAVTWTADTVAHTSIVSTVAGIYFDSETLRDLEPTLNDEQRYPTETLIEKRGIVELEAERITGRAFVPRFGVAEMAGSPNDLVLPEWDIRSVRWIETIAANGTATPWTQPQLDEVTGNLDAGVLSGVVWPTRVRVGFEFGFDHPPDDVRQAAAKRLRWFCNRPASTIPDRATSYTVDGGTYRIQTANRDRTGDDDVDAVYQSWSRREVSVG
jgi:hypothetical protein